MAEKTTIKIFIASAGELADEREKSILILTQLNKSYKHLHLEPILWEIDMVKGNYPDKKSIQDAINPKLKESQVIVFLFYTRIGKNTLIEFELANSENKKMLVLFREGFSPKKEQLKTYGELLDFKESMDAILRMSYDDLDKFENLFYTNLNLYLSETYPIKETLTAPETTALPSSIQKVIQDLTEKDKRIKELEGQLALKPNNKGDDELQKLIAEKEMLHKELQQSEEIIKQQAKDKEGLEKQLTLQKDKDDIKAKALEEIKKGNYAEAKKHLKQSARSSIVETATTFFELAKIEKLEFHYADALGYFELAVKVDPENSLFLDEAGSVADDLGFYDKAIDYYEKSLVIYKNKDGEEHPNVATCYNNLGSVYIKTGEYDKAIEYYNKSLVIDRKSFGEEHSYIATGYNNLGLAYNNKGEYNKAIEFYQKALVIDKKLFGEEYPDIAARYNNLGLAYYNKEECDKAIEFYNKALTIDKKNWGEEHPYIALAYNNLGAAYYKKGENDKTLEFYKKSLSIYKTFYGEEHPDIARGYNNLGFFHFSNGEYDKAIELFKKALVIGKKFLASNHPYILDYQDNLANAQAALDKQKKKKPGE